MSIVLSKVEPFLLTVNMDVNGSVLVVVFALTVFVALPFSDKWLVSAKQGMFEF